MSSLDDSLRWAQLAFQGKIVAGATHEFQNHFAVIKEYNGLVSDLLRAGGDVKRTVSRCTEITGNINERADRAAAMMETLNRFAHRSDRDVCTFKADEAVADLVALMQRMASLKRISIKTSRLKKATINNSPSLLQFLVFSLIDPLLAGLAEGSEITVSATAARKDGGAEIRISSRGSTAPEPAEAAGLDGVEEELAPDLLAFCLEKLGSAIDRERGRRGREEILLTVASLNGAAAVSEPAR